MLLNELLLLPTHRTREQLVPELARGLLHPVAGFDHSTKRGFERQPAGLAGRFLTNDFLHGRVRGAEVGQCGLEMVKLGHDLPPTGCRPPMVF